MNSQFFHFGFWSPPFILGEIQLFWPSGRVAMRAWTGEQEQRSLNELLFGVKTKGTGKSSTKKGRFRELLWSETNNPLVSQTILTIS